MIHLPANPADRAFAIECLLDDVARNRASREAALGMLAQLRAAGDVVGLERVSRALGRA